MQDRSSLPPPLYDAHNHLQDPRLAPHLAPIAASVARENIARMVVNGSAEADWPAVLDLARRDSRVIPSFGYHPWYVRERSNDWQRVLRQCLDQMPSAIGEIGLDRWIKDHDLPLQEQMFVAQLRLAAQRNLPVSIHCLQAWGRLFDLLREHSRPETGFVLHSFGGPGEMVPALAKLGAYFSLPGYFAHERKLRQRETFKTVPLDRLLVETDAPDQLLPDALVKYPLRDLESDKPINHPGNLEAVYAFASRLLGIPPERLRETVQENFLRLFGRFCR
jgi:TatD DNase family protein